jgi:hypothetical protein
MSLKRLIGKITSPIFIPLRKLVVWGDNKFGTCDMKLSLESRWDDTLAGFADIDESSSSVSGLMKKISKDKANLHTWGITKKTPIGNSFPPQKVIDNLKIKQQEEEGE